MLGVGNGHGLTKSEYNKKWCANNPDYYRTWRSTNKGKIWVSNQYQYYENTKQDPQKYAKVLERTRWGARQRKYGISKNQYIEMLSAQAGACFICGVHDENYNLRVDHDHATGKNRALLCHKCNAALGLLNDKPSLLRRAADYIEHHKAP